MNYAGAPHVPGAVEMADTASSMARLALDRERSTGQPAAHTGYGCVAFHDTQYAGYSARSHWLPTSRANLTYDLGNTRISRPEGIIDAIRRRLGRNGPLIAPSSSQETSTFGNKNIAAALPSVLTLPHTWTRIGGGETSQGAEGRGNPEPPYLDLCP